MSKSPAFNQKKVLLLCHYYPEVAGAIKDHIFAFEKYSKNEYFIFSFLGDIPDWLDLSRFDALVFHYSLIACYDNYISPMGRARIRDFQGFKAIFVQDDYRWINDTVEAISYMGFHAIFPLTAPDIMDAVYSPEKLPNVRRETVLAGYVQQDLVGVSVKSYKDRQVDVGYRARKLPAWMGSHTLQKWQIAEKFLKDTPLYELNVDISCREKDRIYGDSWIDFLTNCKATLGTESGASICDYTGEIQRKVEGHLEKHPNESFDVLKKLYFNDEDNKVIMNVISPRSFEAAALRTLMILYEGEYSGVLQPWRHYIPLKRDHSNMDEIVRVIKSPEEAQKIIDQAYEEVAKNEKYSYRAMVDLVDTVMDEEWLESMISKGDRYFIKDEFKWNKTYCKANLEYGRTRGPSYKALQFLLSEPVSSQLHAKEYTNNILKTGEFEIILDNALDVHEIAIKWEIESQVMPFLVEVIGIASDQIKNVYKVKDPEKGKCQSIRIEPEMKKIDLVRLVFNYESDCILKKTHQCFVIVEDSRIFIRKWVQIKGIIMWYLSKYWAILPEGMRRFIRPGFTLLRKIAKKTDLNKNKA